MIHYGFYFYGMEMYIRIPNLDLYISSYPLDLQVSSTLLQNTPYVYATHL